MSCIYDEVNTLEKLISNLGGRLVKPHPSEPLQMREDGGKSILHPWLEIEIQFENLGQFYYVANLLPFKLVKTNTLVSADERDKVIRLYLGSRKSLKALLEVLRELKPLGKED